MTESMTTISYSFSLFSHQLCHQQQSQSICESKPSSNDAINKVNNNNNNNGNTSGNLFLILSLSINHINSDDDNAINQPWIQCFI